MDSEHLSTPDGTQLITLSNGRASGVHVCDLRAIRGRLKELDLDREASDYPPAADALAGPLRVEVDPG